LRQRADLPAFFASPPHACHYLPGRQAVTLFADPRAPLGPSVYAELIDHGFRRSGQYLYRPRCPGCQECIPVRIPVGRFRSSRKDRRTWARNQDLRVSRLAPAYQDEHFALYRRYVTARHPRGGMDEADPARYMEFLVSSWCDTEFYEFRTGSSVLAVAVVDRLPQGLSAVYTFFEPGEAQRSLGRYAILWEIETARREGLPWLYLGYWIRDCPKMSYKSEYRPLQAYRNGRWEDIP
jgi:arginyl-tRNA--protein-N-Asp/Glu arginylyltransferase